MDLPHFGNPGMSVMFDKMTDYWRKLYPPVRIEPYSQEHILKHAPSSRKARIRNAQTNLNATGYLAEYGKCEGFVKFDKAKGYSVRDFARQYIQEEGNFYNDDLSKDACRFIQFRTMEYCYETMRYIKKIEEKIFYRRPSVGGPRFCPTNQRNFAKGMTSFEIAANLRWKTDQFSNPVFILLDHSRFDAHLSKDMRDRLEFSEYLAYNNDPWFKMLLEEQRKSRVKTKSHIEYEVEGTMLSGEANTSCGDCVVNAKMIAYWIKKIKGEWLINGDDSVVICERSDLFKLDFSYFDQIGMKTKIDIVDDFYEVDFCQCKPMRTARGLRMVRDPFRVMSRCSYTPMDFPESGHGIEKYLGAVAMGEKACNSGVPILQEFAELLHRSANGHFSQALYETYMSRRADRPGNPVEVTKEARIDFYTSWGVSPHEQINIENYFRSLKRLPIIYKKKLGKRWIC